MREDGFVTILGDRDVSSVSVLDSDDPNQWIKFGLHRTKSIRKEISTTSVAGSARIAASGIDGPQTNTEICVDWYQCKWGGGCQYTGETYCEVLGGDDNGGIGGDPGRPGCAECKQLAERVKTTRMNTATYALTTNLSVGCSLAAVGAGMTAVEVMAWINLIPEAGQAASIIIGLVGASAEYTDCVARNILLYRETKADAENNYYKDTRDCQEKYTDCK